MRRFSIASFGLAMSLPCCKNDNEGAKGSASTTTDVTTDCRDYCRAQAEAACSPALEPEGCANSCAKTVEAHGVCGESWRATMRCISRVGLACTATGPKANGCASEFSHYTNCVATLSGGGPDGGAP